jgi:glycosyltransferase involved in cell wall biosynthesis
VSASLANHSLTTTEGSLILRKQPLFTIIVPTYNRPAGLAACLEAFCRLDYPRNFFEVIVVDDGSKPPLHTVVSDFLDRLDVTLLTQTNAGPAAARNTGAKRAKGEFLAFIDDDCTPSPDWLQKLSSRFAEIPDHAIGGRTLTASFENPYSAASQALIDAAYAYHNPIPSQASFFASNNLSVPATHFHSIGGFDATFETSEDRDFCDRWRHRGFRMTYAPEILICHSHPVNFSAFWRRHFNYGRGAYRYRQARVRRGTGRLRPDLKFYMRLISNPLMQKEGNQAFWVTVLLLISQIANTMGFLWEGFNRIKKK